MPFWVQDSGKKMVGKGIPTLHLGGMQDDALSPPRHGKGVGHVGHHALLKFMEKLPALNRVHGQS